MTDANFDIVEKLEAFVKARGHTMLELAFSWLAARPTVASVIAGATKPEQIEANVKAAGWELTPEEMAEIDKLTKASSRTSLSPLPGKRCDAEERSSSPMPDLAVERIRPAAAQRDREHDQAPEQRIFVAAGGPAEALRHMRRT